MASAFYESNLQQQRDCLFAETYKSKSFFYQLSFRSNVVSINCRSINCHFDQVSFDQLSYTIETTIFHAGMWSVHPSLERSYSLLRETTKFGCYSSAGRAWSDAVRSIDFSHSSPVVLNLFLHIYPFNKSVY